MSARATPTNRWGARLLEQRLSHHWSRQDVVDKISEIYTPQNKGREAGLDVTTVRRWEKGIQMPSRAYREALCQLYGISAEALELLP